MRLADGRYLPVERATMHATTGSGPGGQHRNRSQTRVELRLPLAIMGLTPAELDRIRALLHQLQPSSQRFCDALHVTLSCSGSSLLLTYRNSQKSAPELYEISSTTRR